jgi:hypothetical protein
MILLAILCWLIREFLAGCGAHVRGMYTTPLSTRMLGALYRLHHYRSERSVKARGPNCTSLQAMQRSENRKPSEEKRNQ